MELLFDLISVNVMKVGKAERVMYQYVHMDVVHPMLMSMDTAKTLKYVNVS